ncbi:UNVERIFIED_CONTAM: hypothetical protein Slati_2424400 [Sesamum latifolium]|uniref:Uncharacterized protein n=1 Tax=Sesamum latifolium TaxID=2727402 RepID=A0AAW2WCH0_9LAMI
MVLRMAGDSSPEEVSEEVLHLGDQPLGPGSVGTGGSTGTGQGGLETTCRARAALGASTDFYLFWTLAGVSIASCLGSVLPTDGAN